jgi:uncharacterized protein (TIGR02996 family)
MNLEEALLQAIHDSPGDDTPRLVLADWLEEHDQHQRAELLRLQVVLRTISRGPERLAREKRVQELLAGGVRPCVPEVVNSLGMRLALIPPGSFLMGAAERRPGDSQDEQPQHEVEISRAFYLGVTEVTQEQYEKVMVSNPSYFAAGAAREGNNRLGADVDTRSFPVDSVSHEDATELCRRLSALPAEKRAGRRYRLPSEAEWEYACRAGIFSTDYHFGAKLESSQANFSGAGRSVAVASFGPNAWGLFDMHGNVWEWCADWYHKDYYKTSPRRDPTGPTSGARRVIRGGGWTGSVHLCRASLRGHNSADARHSYNGCRVVLEVPARSA